MGNPTVMPEQSVKAGTRLFMILIGGKHSDTLNYLHYGNFLEMVSSSKVVDS